MMNKDLIDEYNENLGIENNNLYNIPIHTIETTSISGGYIRSGHIGNGVLTTDSDRISGLITINNNIITISSPSGQNLIEISDSGITLIGNVRIEERN